MPRWVLSSEWHMGNPSLTATLSVVIWSGARLVLAGDFGPFIDVIRVCEPRCQHMDGCVCSA